MRYNSHSPTYYWFDFLSISNLRENKSSSSSTCSGNISNSVGYVMRHEDYHNSPLPNLYVQIARWCNQQAFYKKMSFWEFVYRNQSFWEETTKKIVGRPKQKSYDFLGIIFPPYF